MLRSILNNECVTLSEKNVMLSMLSVAAKLKKPSALKAAGFFRVS